MPDKFTWVPLYRELADELANWEPRQGELIEFLEKLRNDGQRITPLTDQDDQGNKFLLKEIDPFTFFGTFNRSITDENRIAILGAMKAHFGAKSDLPSDFLGIPVLHPMKSWFIAYGKDRDQADVARLWKVFRLALGKDPLATAAFLAAFDEAFKVSSTKLNLTMGLFWIRPETFLNLDKNNRNYLNIKVPSSGLTADFYRNAIQAARQEHPGKSFPEISYEAWAGEPPTPPPPPPPPTPEANMKTLLEQFRQVILYGPPGTGKTREAMRVAFTLLSGQEPADEATPQAIEKELKQFRVQNRFDLVVFHPAYEYEQFVGGIEPMVTAGHLVFEPKAGVFLRLCRAAENHQKPVVLIIDEINRGNLPKLLGELVYALEYRDHAVRLPFEWAGRTDLVIPKNLHIIATMNSADRSIGHIDVAIRRRFGLYHQGPSSDVVRMVWSSAGDESYGLQLAKLMERLNERLGTGSDLSTEVELGVGHSYFLPVPGSSIEAAKEQVRMRWAYQVQPLLREYAQLLNRWQDFQAFFKKTLDQALVES